MVQVKFSSSGQTALQQLPTDVQDVVLSTLDGLHNGDRDRSKLLSNDRGGKYHYFIIENSSKEYIILVDLDRHYSKREDEAEIVDMGETSDFLIDS